MNWFAEGRLPGGGRDVPKKLRFGNESDKNEAKDAEKQASKGATRARTAIPC
jgi:hypothetical protein